jgi:choline dehydrogenase-like flavoprotein
MDEAMDDVMRAVKFQTAGVPSTMTSQLHPDSQRRPDLLVHEAGTMWMGDDPNTSVTDLWGRVHEAKNLFISGTALFPSVGSHNGSLTATALALRLADRLLAQM